MLLGVCVCLVQYPNYHTVSDAFAMTFAVTTATPHKVRSHNSCTQIIYCSHGHGFYSEKFQYLYEYEYMSLQIRGIFANCYPENRTREQSVWQEIFYFRT